MKAKSFLWIGVAVIAIAGAGGYWFSQRPAAVTAVAESSAPMATPPGITLQPLGDMRGYTPIAIATPAPNRGTAYGDARGMTLYVSDKDIEPGKSACAGDCTKTWPAVIASQDTKPFGDWSLIARGDGAKQWALKGKPLYTYAPDAKIGDAGGNGAESGAWHAAMAQADIANGLPFGIATQEVSDAGGQVLVDAQGMTLYAFSGDANRDRPVCAAAPCANRWIPVATAQIANPVGDFTIVSRDDGIDQWAYKGKPLYRFDGDLASGDANGIGLDGQHRPALLVKYFMPAEAGLHPTLEVGKVLATADGMTLYRRDSYVFMPAAGHSLRRAAPGLPVAGRTIGTKGCEGDCLKTWHPLLAPPNAQPEGYWDVMTRSDGSKQWAYKGYALYSYAGDKKPGDMNGNDIYDMFVNDGVHKTSYVGPPMATAIAQYWAYAVP